MAGSNDSTPLKIFVRIGALKRFHMLKQKTADLPVSVEWDRRRGERGARSAADRKPVERRGDLPYTWDAADFVVVEDDPTTPQGQK